MKGSSPLTSTSDASPAWPHRRVVGHPSGGDDRRGRLRGRDRDRRRGVAVVARRRHGQARRQRLGRLRGHSGVPPAVRRRRDRHPRRGRSEEADADRRHRPPARARDLSRREAGRQRPVRGPRLPGHRRSRGDAGGVRPGHVHQRGGGAVQPGDPRADQGAQGRLARRAAAGPPAVPEDRPEPGLGAAGPVDRQRPVRLLDRLRPDAARSTAEVEVRLPLPLRPGRADLDPAAIRDLRGHQA